MRTLALCVLFLGCGLGTVNAAVCNNTNLDLLFVLDASASICCGTNCNNNPPASCSNYNLMKDFVVQLLTAFSPAIDVGGVRTGLLVYSGSTLCYLFPNGTTNYCRLTQIYDHWHFSNFTTAADMVTEVNTGVVYDGGATYTAAALDHAFVSSYAQSSGARSNINNLTIVITDGVTSDGADLPTKATQLQSISTVLAVGIVGANQTELQTIATNPTSDVFNINSFSAISAAVDQIVKRSCTIAGGSYSNVTLPVPGTSTGGGGSGAASLSSASWTLVWLTLASLLAARWPV